MKTRPKRRSEVTQEADFYGSWTGQVTARRAIAGILIILANVVGGLLVGVLQHGMSIGSAAESHTLLTIGDGLPPRSRRAGYFTAAASL